MPPPLRRGGRRGGGGVVRVRLVVGRGGGGELQAAGSHAERLLLLCDVQQLDLTAGQDEVTVEQLRRPSPPFPSAPNSSPAAAPLAVSPALHLRRLEDVGRGVPQRSASPYARPPSSSSTRAAAVAAQEAAGLQGRRGGEGRGGQQVQLTRALGTAGVIVAVGGEEDLRGALLV